MLRDYHTIGESGQISFGGTDWAFQSFTPWVSYSISNVDLKFWRRDNPGIITVSIRAVDVSHKPTGPDLVYGTTDGDTLSTSSPGEWRGITFNTSQALTADTEYAIVVRSVSTIAYWRVSNSSNYGYGVYSLSPDSGVSWIPPSSTQDLMFKTYDDQSYTPQIIYVGGEEYDGKHLWKLQDDGEDLSLVEGYTLPGDVNALAFSSVTKRLYVGIGSSIYCYDTLDMSLVTAWGSSGSVNIGNTVNGLDVNGDDDLAVAHSKVDVYKRISLYDNTGSLLWTSTVFGTSTVGHAVSFDLNGNINACTMGGSSGTYIAACLKFSDGTLQVGYQTRVVSGYNGTGIASSKTVNGYCYYLSSYSLTILYCDDENGNNVFSESIVGVGTEDVLHLSGVSLVIVANGSELRSYVDSNGSNLKTNSFSAAFKALIANNSNEIYAAGNTGYVSAINANLSARSELQISTNSLASIVWAGDAYIAPVITDQSTDTNAEYGDEVEFFVTASGNPEPTYQWYKDGGLLTGEVFDTLTLTDVDANDGGTYRCKVSNAAGDVWSSEIDLRIVPYVISQTGNISIARNSEVTLTVTGAGFPSPTYQWYKGVVLLTGETSATLTKFWTAPDAGTYKCKLTNGAGSVDSKNIVVTIVSNPYVYKLFNIPFDIDRET